MKRAFQSAALAVLVLAMAPLTAAQTTRIYQDPGGAWVEETTGQLAAARTLRVNSALGTVRVQGTEQNQITYTVRKRIHRTDEDTARRQFRSLNVTAAIRGAAAVLDADWTGARHGRLSAEFIVQVPRGMDIVRVSTAGGNVTATNIAGQVTLETSGGNVQADEIGGAVTVRTSGGNVGVSKSGGNVRVETAGGSIKIGEAAGEVRANTFGGSIHLGSSGGLTRLETAGGGIYVKRCGGELRAVTAGGNIEVAEVHGPARVETAGGGIRIRSAQGRVVATTAGGSIQLLGMQSSVRAETAAGGIQAEFTSRSSFQESYLGTTMGDVVVFLPESVPVTVRAAIELSNGHRITSDFQGLKITSEGGSYGPREIYGEGMFNGGGGLLKVHTTSGNIEFRRASRR